MSSSRLKATPEQQRQRNSMDIHGQPFCVSSALCRLCQFWFHNGESVTADLRDTKARRLVSFPFSQNGTHVDGDVTIHIACTKRGCWCQPGILCFHTSCYSFYCAKFGQTSHLLVDSMYSDYTPAFSLERKRTAYILSLLERQTTSNTLATFPPELRRLVARDLVREYAVVNLHHLVHTAPIMPDTVTIDLEQDVYASYVRIEGSTYVQSLHNKAPQGAHLGCRHIHSPHPGQIVRSIFLEYDHLGIRGVHMCAPRSDSQQTVGDVWWVELRRHQGIRHILAVSDGLKVRGIMDGMEQDATDGSIRAPAWPEPLTEFKVIDLEGLTISAFPPRGLRMNCVEFNAPHVDGYLIAIFRRQQVIKLQAHHSTANPNFYDDADIICKDLMWIYMPVDAGEYVKEIGTLRCTLRPPSQLHWSATLMLVTNRGRAAILGKIPSPRYTYSRVHEVGTSPSKIYMNEVDSVRDGQRVRYVGVQAANPTCCWERPANPKSWMPKSIPYRFGQSHFYSCCRLENVAAVTPCCGKRLRHQPVIGMLLQYHDGTRACVGQYRLDWTLDAVLIRPELPMWIRQGELESDKKYVSEVRLHGRETDDEARSWQEIPWYGMLEWWYLRQEARVIHVPSKPEQADTGGQP